MLNTMIKVGEDVLGALGRFLSQSRGLGKAWRKNNN